MTEASQRQQQGRSEATGGLPAVVEPDPAAFVGRHRERLTVEQFVSAVGEGRSGLLLVDAEAGAGKTALLRVGAAVAERSGAAVLHGRGDHHDVRSYRCLAEALACRPTSTDPTRARIGQLLRSAGPTSGIGAAPAIEELIAEVLERAATAGPTLLVLDDLQWVDDASVTLAASLTRRLTGRPFGVLAATRPSARVARALDGATLQRCPLDAFEDGDLELLARQLTRATPTVELLAAMREVRTNAFLVQLVANVASDPQATTPLRQDLLRSMTLRLEPEHRGFLQLAAMAGREIDVDVLAEAGTEPVTSVVHRVRACERLGWLESDVDTVRFRHDLLVDALIATIPLDVRDRMHLQLGRATGRLGHAPGRMAFHLDAASYLLSPSDLPHLHAALRAVPADDPLALSLAQRAHDIDPTDATAACAAMRCLAVRHRHEAALAIGERWLAQAGIDDGDRGRVRLAVAASMTFTATAASVIEYLDTTIASCALTAVQRAEALNTIARLHWHSADAARVAGAASLALEASRAAAWPTGEVLARCTRSESAALRGLTEEALADARAAQEIAARDGVGEVAAPALALGTAVAAAGRMREALPILTTSLRAAERAGDHQAMVLAQVTMQATRYHVGAWDDFVADADAMVEIGRESGTRAGIVLPLGFATAVAMRRGRPTEVAALAARVRAEHTIGDAHPGATLGVALAELAESEASGSTAKACRTACALVELLARAGPSAQSIVVVDAARLAWQVGDRERLRALQVLTEASAAASPTPNRRCVAAYIGALATGDPGAIAASARQLAATERIWDGATSLHVAGLALAPTSPHDAAPLLSEAATRYEGFGAQALAAAARAGRPLRLDLDHDEVAADAPPPVIEQLSAAERRVLRLVAAGEANGAIADALYISKRTVESHIAALYRKLGAATRVELARFGATTDDARHG